MKSIKFPIQSTLEPAILDLDMYLEKIIISKDTCTPKFTTALLTTARTWRQPKCPSVEEWIKMSYNGILLSHNKKGNNAICDNMNGT